MARARTYQHTSRARSTGTLVTVCESDGGEIAEGLPWMTVCDEHGGCVCHATLALARSWASAPESWCDDCRDGRCSHGMFRSGAGACPACAGDKSSRTG